jgi:hypothetical protein
MCVTATPCRMYHADQTDSSGHSRGPLEPSGFRLNGANDEGELNYAAVPMTIMPEAFAPWLG